MAPNILPVYHSSLMQPMLYSLILLPLCISVCVLVCLCASPDTDFCKLICHSRHLPSKMRSRGDRKSMASRGLHLIDQWFWENPLLSFSFHHLCLSFSICKPGIIKTAQWAFHRLVGRISQRLQISLAP